MVKLLRLFPDMTFEEKNRRTEQDKIKISKEYTPSFKIGTSVFRERPRPFLIRLLVFWKRPRNLALIIDGAPQSMSLEVERGDKPALSFNFGTMKDTIKFVYQIVAKSKGEQKPISNTQFLVLALLLGAVLMFQFMLMKGVKL